MVMVRPMAKAARGSFRCRAVAKITSTRKKVRMISATRPCGALKPSPTAGVPLSTASLPYRPASKAAAASPPKSWLTQ